MKCLLNLPGAVLPALRPPYGSCVVATCGLVRYLLLDEVGALLRAQTVSFAVPSAQCAAGSVSGDREGQEVCVRGGGGPVEGPLPLC